jgi:hypothetical protein
MESKNTLDRIMGMETSNTPHMIIWDDLLGQKYSCSVCAWAPYRLINLKGWGKAQHLKGLVRKHIKDCHLLTTTKIGKTEYKNSPLI